MADKDPQMFDQQKDIRQLMHGLSAIDRETRFVRLIAARRHGRLGCKRLFTLRGNYDSGSFVCAARAAFAARQIRLDTGISRRT
jgi:hypothetical protein